MRVALAAFTLLMISGWSSWGAEKVRNIFDDDWTPPKPLAPDTSPGTPPPVHPSAVPDVPHGGLPTPAPSQPSIPGVSTPNAGPAQPAQPSARATVPAKLQQAAARKVMKEVYSKELADRSAAGRLKLGESLQAASERATDVPTDKFVLLAAAIDAAVEAGSIPLAFTAADQMAKGFDVDVFAVKADAAMATAAKPAVPGFATSNVRAVLVLTDELALGEYFGTAMRLCAALQTQVAADAALRSVLVDRQRELVATREAATRAARDLEKLRTSPNDPAVNLSVGKYLCFTKRDWEEGLPRLAKGSDPGLKNAALQEIANPSTPDAIAIVGDAWWTLAAKQTVPSSRAAVADHAAGLYKRAIDGLAGLRHELIAKRLTEAANMANTTTVRKASKLVDLLARMEGKGAAPQAGVVVLKRGVKITSHDSFKPPVAFRLVLQLESEDLRVAYAADQIIFNWGGNKSELRIDGGPASGKHKKGAGGIPAQTWVTIDVMVTANAMTLSVDGEQRYKMEADFSKVDDRLSILAFGSAVTVRSVTVSRPAE
jgi:hypothetical protein